MNSPLLTCNLLFKFHFTVVMVICCFQSIVCTSLLYFVVRVGCRRKQYMFAISSPDELLVVLVFVLYTVLAAGILNLSLPVLAV